MSEWQPIETAPRDGSLILCWAEGWDEPVLLKWKTNPRTGLSYFGDPHESDDYDLADIDAATQWFAFPNPLA